MRNQDNYGDALYENDQWKRFEIGSAPSSSADWGWFQHIAASLNDASRAAVVLDTGAVSRGSASKSSNKEKTIGQAFVEADLIEAVVKQDRKDVPDLRDEGANNNLSAPGSLSPFSGGEQRDRDQSANDSH